MRISFINIIFLVNFGRVTCWPERNMNGTVMDISMDCVNNFKKHIFLPFSMGVSDSATLILSNKYHYRDCTIIFHHNTLARDLMNIVVVEFENQLNTFDSICNDSKIYLTEKLHKETTIDLCALFGLSKFDNPFVFTTALDLNIGIKDLKRQYFQVIKITGTATKPIHEDSSCINNETTCYFGSNASCISDELNCDGLNNCGYANLFDEDPSICNKKYVTHELYNIAPVGACMALVVLIYLQQKFRKAWPLLKTLVITKGKRKNDTIAFANRSPATVKTYIPVKPVDTLHFRVMSTTSLKTSEETPQYKLLKGNSQRHNFR